MPAPIPFIPADLLESLIRDNTKIPFQIYWSRCTPLSPSAVQQLEQQAQFLFGENYSILRGYRVPVRFQSEPERVIFYQAFRCNFNGWVGWDATPEEDVRERLLKDKFGE
jgi:hypothetical protein